jgi:hypothetical protein
MRRRSGIGLRYAEPPVVRSVTVGFTAICFTGFARFRSALLQMHALVALEDFKRADTHLEHVFGVERRLPRRLERFN